MTWNLPPGPMDPGFGHWLPLPAALDGASDLAGLYLVRSNAVASSWGASGTSDLPWRLPGVVYVGISSGVRTRLGQFTRAAKEGRAVHPGGYWFHHSTLSFLGRREGFSVDEDISIATAYPPFAPPEGVRPTEPRWAAAVRQALEAVESSLVADVMAHRLATGCEWRLLNDVDRSTYPGVR